MNTGKIVVAIRGARMHYAVPMMLHRRSMLARFYTDVYLPARSAGALSTIGRYLRLPAALRRLAGRTSPVPVKLVETCVALEAAHRLRLLLPHRGTAKVIAESRVESRFCRWVSRRLPADVRCCYAVNGAALELFEHCRTRGIACVLEQSIGAYRDQYQLIRRERERFPGWEEDRLPENGGDREEAEWSLADRIIAPSSFVAESLRSMGVPSERISIVPYGFNAGGQQRQRRPRPSGALRVLFVGAVGLRKGVPYLLEAARRLSSDVEVRVVGPLVSARDKVDRSAPRNVQVIGPVPRAEVKAHFDWADVFCLPSLFEGSATVTYEALAYGLPVICTSESGSVVSHGRTGLIVESANTSALVDALSLLSADRHTLNRMSEAAISSVSAYSWECYEDRLLSVLSFNEQRLQAVSTTP